MQENQFQQEVIKNLKNILAKTDNLIYSFESLNIKVKKSNKINIYLGIGLFFFGGVIGFVLAK